ncbi:isopentenyl phosphate kinase [Priestia flexa]|uniref:isopentenyl phosphate kinase n=1 Tax=Priestia flexa TaxID=86664 RepID=UPI00077C512D|nr:isopentenyl phosphate kinase [Priestia flexa]MED4590504.1 isopentenyl phosphate kinase [Priestia flexa]
MFVVKIGGSLITNKNEYCSPNKEEIRKFAKVLKARWEDLRGKLIIVIGGGSYGNGVPIRFNIEKSEQDWKAKDLLMMTVKMFEWLTEVCMIFREEGLPCYPFQSSSYCTTNNGELINYNIGAIEKSLELGLLPITSGDLTFDDTKTFVIYSSDNIPEIFVDYFRVKRVVILTDVDGIYESLKDQNLIKRVNKDNYENILNIAGSSNKQDVTGGMNNKVKALIRIAQKGTTSIICNGNNPESLIEGLYSDTPPGTTIEAWN